MVTIASIRKRQGIAPPVTESARAEYEQAKRERRAKNVVNAREILSNNHVGWDEWPDKRHDGHGILFRVRKPTGLVALDYYPEIGLWVDNRGDAHYGCRNLVRYLKGEVI